MFIELYNVCQNGVRLFVRNVTFSSFSAISWLPGEKTRTDPGIPQQLVDLWNLWHLSGNRTTNQC